MRGNPSPLVARARQSSLDLIPFNRPATTGAEQAYLAKVFERGKFGGGGPFSIRCNAWLKDHFEAPSAFTTTSCTHALEKWQPC